LTNQIALLQAKKVQPSMQKNQKSDWYFNLSIYTFVIIGSWIAVGYQFPIGGNFPKLPQIQHLLNPELYKNDYHLQEMVKFNPRYYYYYIIYFLANLGLIFPWCILFINS
jgi:hypothetical protein